MTIRQNVEQILAELPPGVQLVAAAKATSLVFEGDPMLQFPSWLGLLAGFDLVYWSLGFVLFPRVLED